MLPVRKEPRWKKEQRQRRVSRTRRLALTITSIIIIVILVGGILKIYPFISQNSWDGKSQLNLVINARPLLLLSLNPDQKKINTLIIPSETLVKAIHGYGPYRAESIFPLGEMEAGQGGDLLAESIQEFFGLPVDGWINFPAGEINREKSQQWLQGLFFDLVLGRVETSFNLWESVRFCWRLSGLRRYSFNLVSLEETTASEKVSLPDGSQAIQVEPERFRRIASKLFNDSRVSREGLAIAVINGTSHSGLATQASRIIDNLGGRVVEVGEWEGKTSSCQIRSAKEEEKTYTFKRLKKIFQCQWISEEREGYRADLILILGEDYWRKLTENYE